MNREDYCAVILFLILGSVLGGFYASLKQDADARRAEVHIFYIKWQNEGFIIDNATLSGHPNIPIFSVGKNLTAFDEVLHSQNMEKVLYRVDKWEPFQSEPLASYLYVFSIEKNIVWRVVLSGYADR